MSRILNKFENRLSIPNPESPVEKSKIFFFTSTKKGLGHISRSTAIHENLNEKNFSATIGAYNSVIDYIKGVNPLTEVHEASYDFSPSSLPENLDDEELYTNFVEQNNKWLSSLTDTSIIVTDFVASSIFIRRYLLEKKLINTKIVGVYHSFIEENKNQDDDIKSWQSSVSKVVDNLDICFVAELKSEHSIPWITSEGTLIIPTDPVVHKRKKSNEEVKVEIGLKPTDDYILIQAGMRGNGSLKEFILSIAEDSPHQFVLLGWNLDDLTREEVSKHPRVKILEKVLNGHELVGAASGVIAKPGMQTLSEAIAYNVPIIFLPDDHPERKLKIEMLRNLLSDESIPYLVDESLPYSIQIERWLEVSKKQFERFEEIDGNGAEQIARYLDSFHLEEHLASLVDSEKPQPITETPPGKIAERLSEEESREKVVTIRREIKEKVCKRLTQSGIKHTFILFGGVAKEMLRPDSDVDALLVVEDESLDLPIDSWDITLLEPLTPERIASLRTGQFDSLRLKAKTSSGMELNISLMTNNSYKKIFRHSTPYFNEELGKKISGTPYHVSDFRGGIHTLPKVINTIMNGIQRKERRSPGVTYQKDGATIFGVKHRMLLTAENLSDDFEFGDPTRKLIRSMTRAVLYWNDLYIRKNGKIVGIAPESFDANYFFRLLRDPLDMVGPKIQRKIKNLYFNELRRLQIIYQRKNSKT